MFNYKRSIDSGKNDFLVFTINLSYLVTVDNKLRQMDAGSIL